MSPARRTALSDEDRVLWTLVAKSATPLKGRKALAEADPPEPTVEEKTPAIRMAAEPRAASAPKQKRQPVGQELDRPTLQKLSRGKLPIEGRVDLHGMTQEEAYALLLSFLQRAYANGVRYVLIITGKGSSSGGILRRQVPAWLSTPPFRMLVSSHDVSARHHGGDGALYVRLRKKA